MDASCMCICTTWSFVYTRPHYSLNLRDSSLGFVSRSLITAASLGYCWPYKYAIHFVDPLEKRKSVKLFSFLFWGKPYRLSFKWHNCCFDWKRRARNALFWGLWQVTNDSAAFSDYHLWFSSLLLIFSIGECRLLLVSNIIRSISIRSTSPSIYTDTLVVHKLS